MATYLNPEFGDQQDGEKTDDPVDNRTVPASNDLRMIVIMRLYTSRKTGIYVLTTSENHNMIDGFRSDRIKIQIIITP